MARKSRTSREGPIDPPEVGCAWFVTTLALVAWGLLAWSGYFGWSITGPRRPISPYYSSDWGYYIAVPFGLAIVAGLLFTALLASRRLAWGVVALSGLLVVGLLPYILLYASGS